MTWRGTHRDGELDETHRMEHWIGMDTEDFAVAVRLTPTLRDASGHFTLVDERDLHSERDTTSWRKVLMAMGFG